MQCIIIVEKYSIVWLNHTIISYHLLVAMFLNGQLTLSIFKYFPNIMGIKLYFLITQEAENIWICVLAFVFSPLVNLFTSFASTSNVFINLTNIYGMFLWTECLYPQISCWNHNLQCDGIRRWDFWSVIRLRWNRSSPMGDAPMMGLLLLQKRETLELTVFLPKDTQQDGSYLQARKRALARYRIGQHLGPFIPESPELWETNACCLSRPVYGILLSQPKLRQVSSMYLVLCYMPGIIQL